MTWYAEKTGLKRARCFLCTNKSPTLQISFLGVQCLNLYAMYVPLRRHDFVVKVMDVGKSTIVWSRNNGCHMSQENVIKFGVALCPWFPDSYSVSWTSMQLVLVAMQWKKSSRYSILIFVISRCGCPLPWMPGAGAPVRPLSAPHWTHHIHNRPVINMVCYEWVCYEWVCCERGLLWTWSAMNRSVIYRSVLKGNLLRNVVRDLHSFFSS